MNAAKGVHSAAHIYFHHAYFSGTGESQSVWTLNGVKVLDLWSESLIWVSDLSLLLQPQICCFLNIYCIYCIYIVVSYISFCYIYFFLCHNLNMVQCLLIEFYWQRNNRRNEIRSYRRINFTTALITGFFYSGYHSITGHYTLLLQWNAVIDSILFSVHPSGRHVFVLRAWLINRKPKRGVHSGLSLMHGSKVHENRRHHSIMRSVTVGCSQRSLESLCSVKDMLPAE